MYFLRLFKIRDHCFLYNMLCEIQAVVAVILILCQALVLYCRASYVQTNSRLLLCDEERSGEMRTRHRKQCAKTFEMYLPVRRLYVCLSLSLFLAYSTVAALEISPPNQGLSRESPGVIGTRPIVIYSNA